MLQERIVFDDLEIGEIANDLDDQEPQDVIAWSLETFGDHIAIVSSLQADSMAVLDMAYRLKPDVHVITVDTWRLPRATLKFLDQVREHYPDARWEVLSPDAREVEAMVARHEPDLFYKAVPLRLLCCQIRKVRPLLSALQGLDAWFTGLRRDQWASRANIKKVELDHDHDGIVKVNPLADWTKEEVWEYLEHNGVPVHPLYEQGYTSIGCEPCTRPIEVGEQDRSGRWWWETNAPKECGMHCAIETGGLEHELEALIGNHR